MPFPSSSFFVLNTIPSCIDFDIYSHFLYGRTLPEIVAYVLDQRSCSSTQNSFTALPTESTPRNPLPYDLHLSSVLSEKVVEKHIIPINDINLSSMKSSHTWKTKRNSTRRSKLVIDGISHIGLTKVNPEISSKSLEKLSVLTSPCVASRVDFSINRVMSDEHSETNSVHLSFYESNHLLQCDSSKFSSANKRLQKSGARSVQPCVLHSTNHSSIKPSSIRLENPCLNCSSCLSTSSHSTTSSSCSSSDNLAEVSESDKQLLSKVTNLSRQDLSGIHSMRDFSVCKSKIGNEGLTKLDDFSVIILFKSGLLFLSSSLLNSKSDILVNVKEKDIFQYSTEQSGAKTKIPKRVSINLSSNPHDKDQLNYMAIPNKPLSFPHRVNSFSDEALLCLPTGEKLENDCHLVHQEGSVCAKCSLPHSTCSFAQHIETDSNYFFSIKEIRNFELLMTSHDLNIIENEVIQQCTFFEIAEALWLSAPNFFLSSPYIPISIEDRFHMINMHYNLDDTTAVALFGDRNCKIEILGDGISTLTLNQRGIAVRRQCESVKNVASTICAAYRGKNDTCFPVGVNLVEGICQYYGFPFLLSSTYAVLTIGYEHKLNFPFFKRLDMNSLHVICAIFQTLWFDHTGLLLESSFLISMNRFTSLLSNSSVLSELFRQIFGETLRPRWQTHLENISIRGDRRLSSISVPLPFSDSPKINSNKISELSFQDRNTNSLNSNRLPNILTTHNINDKYDANPSTTKNLGLNYQATPERDRQESYSCYDKERLNNPVFSRRFSLEYHYLMKSLIRITTALHNRRLREAVDVFYNRIYLPFSSVPRNETTRTVASVFHLGRFKDSNALDGTSGTRLHEGLLHVQPDAIFLETHQNTASSGNMSTSLVNPTSNSLLPSNSSFHGDASLHDQFLAHDSQSNFTTASESQCFASIEGKKQGDLHSKSTGFLFYNEKSNGIDKMISRDSNLPFLLLNLFSFFDIFPKVFENLKSIPVNLRKELTSDVNHFFLGLKLLGQHLISIDT